VAVGDDSRAGEAGGSSWIVPLLVLVSGTFMAVLDTSITTWPSRR